MEAGERSFAELSQAWGRPVRVERLAPFARWITPEGSPYRFNTLFFLLEASPYEADVELIWAEFESLAWRKPAELLASAGVGRQAAPPR